MRKFRTWFVLMLPLVFVLYVACLCGVLFIGWALTNL